MSGWRLVFDNRDEKVHPWWACVENFMELSWSDPKLYLDLWKCFHGVEDGLWKYYEVLKIIFESHQNGWKEVYCSHRSFIWTFRSTFMGLKIGFWSTIRGWRLFLKVIKMVEERLRGLIKALSWLKLCFKKFYLDLWKCFHGVKIGFGSTLQGIEIGF